MILCTRRSVHLHTREGVTLKRMAQRNAWVWVARPQPKANAIAVGCEDGSVAMLRLSFATVHGLHGERYVYRDVVTDVVIQHLVTDQRVRIKCRYACMWQLLPPSWAKWRFLPARIKSMTSCNTMHCHDATGTMSRRCQCIGNALQSLCQLVSLCTHWSQGAMRQRACSIAWRPRFSVAWTATCLLCSRSMCYSARRA